MPYKYQLRRTSVCAHCKQKIYLIIGAKTEGSHYSYYGYSWSALWSHKPKSYKTQCEPKPGHLWGPSAKPISALTIIHKQGMYGWK